MFPQIPAVTITPPQIRSAASIYNHVPAVSLSYIARERDIHLVGTVREQAEQLANLDIIQPKWLAVIRNQSHPFNLKYPHLFHVWGATRGIDLSRVYEEMDVELQPRYILLLTLAPSLPVSQLVLKFAAGYLEDGSEEVVAALLVRLTGRKEMQLANQTEMLAALKGQMHLVNIPPQAWTRYNKLADLTIDDNISLSKLYNIPFTEITKLARLPVHPLEPYLLDEIPWEVSQFAGAGKLMLIPKPIRDNSKQYIKDNLLAYTRCVDSRRYLISTSTLSSPNSLLPKLESLVHQPKLRDTLELFTDEELFTIFGVYVGYNSRVDLITKLLSTLTMDGFFFLTQRGRAINTKTFMLNDVTDTSITMLGYGRASRYRAYELEDFIYAFYTDSATGVARFRRPENTKVCFSKEAVASLMDLLRFLDPNLEVTTLTSQVELVHLDMSLRRERDRISRHHINTVFVQTDRDNIKNFFQSLFRVGMFLRRWDGVSSYPVRESDTKGTFHEDKVKQSVGETMEILAALTDAARDFVFKMDIFNAHQAVVFQDGTVKYWWDGVIAEKVCIRMASSCFITSSWFYLSTLFDVRLPNFNIADLEKAQ